MVSAIPVFTLKDPVGKRKKLTYNEAICLVNKQIVDDLVDAVVNSKSSENICKSCEAGKYGQLIVTINERL